MWIYLYPNVPALHQQLADTEIQSHRCGNATLNKYITVKLTNSQKYSTTYQNAKNVSNSQIPATQTLVRIPAFVQQYLVASFSQSGSEKPGISALRAFCWVFRQRKTTASVAAVELPAPRGGGRRAVP